MLLPVIGLLNTYGEFMADRFTYLPMIGILVAVVWLSTDWLVPSSRRRIGVAAVVCVCLIALALKTSSTVQHWRSSETLFRRALAVTRDNSLAHNALGHTLAVDGRAEEAVVQFRRAISLKPSYADAHNNLGATLIKLGDRRQAIEHFQRAIEVHPNHASACNNLSWVLATHSEPGPGDAAEAVRLAERACALTHRAEPAYLDTLSAAYHAAGRGADAENAGLRAVELAHRLGYHKLARDIEQRLAQTRAVLKSGQ